MHTILIIYLLGLIAIPAAFIWLKWQYKWVTKTNLNDEVSALIPIILLGLLAWPLAVIIVGIVLLIRYAYKHLIPD